MNTRNVMVFFLLFVTACSRDLTPTPLEPIENTITGEWVFAERYVSTGGPGQWYAVTPPNQHVTFNTDGTFIPSESFLDGATNYALVDSVTVKIWPATTTSGFRLMRFRIDTAMREMELDPADLFCIEGCTFKFRK